MNYKDVIKRQTKVIAITAIALSLVVIGATYAAFMQVDTNTQDQEVVAGYLRIVYGDGSTITEDMVPMSDTQGMAQNGYTFTVTNNGIRESGDLPLEYFVSIFNNKDVGAQDFLAHSQYRISIDGSEPVYLSDLAKTADTATETVENNIKRLLLTDWIDVRNTAGDTSPVNMHTIKIWIKEDADTNIVGKKVNLQIKVTGEVYKPTCEKVENIDNLQCRILAQYGGISAINEAPANTFASASNASTNEMYKMEDDYGMSYYYRGAKDLLNNNLIFANHQWKIVRINGDGSTRIIYNGVCPNNTCTINSTGTATQIKTTAWNLTNSNDAKYVGYMYGGSNGNSSSSRAQAVTNQTSSNAKVELESWYTTHIEISEYDSYISDTLFCNDRGATGTGFGSSESTYAAYHRLSTSKKTPTLSCGNKNDKFTVDDVSIGNGDLDKPVGLITADEVALAGGAFNANNTSYYLYTSQEFYMFSPYDMSVGTAYMWGMANMGNWTNNSVRNAFGLRSVINLNSDVQVTGTGSTTDPFKVIG